MAPDASYQPSPTVPRGEAAIKVGRAASLLGRIGVRAFIIVLLMLAALGALAATGLQILARQNTIIEQLGVRDRVAIDAEHAFSTPIFRRPSRR